MLEPLNKENIPNYYKYASPYIKDIFDKNGAVVEYIKLPLRVTDTYIAVYQNEKLFMNKVLTES